MASPIGTAASGKVLDFITHAEAAKAVPLQLKVEVYERAIREWVGHITVNEFTVLMAIIDRTIAWGRTEAYFSTYALLEGDTLYAGLPLSRRTLFRSLSKLAEIGLIRRRRDRANAERVHFSVNLRWKPGMVNLPKRLQGVESGCHTGTSRCQCGTDQCQCGTVITVSPTVSPNDSLVRGLSPRPAIESENPFPGKTERRPQPQTPSPRQRTRMASPAVLIREWVAQADAVSRAQRADEQASPRRPRAQATSAIIEGAWRQAIIETFPHNIIPAWTVREKWQAKTAAANWLHRDQIDLPSFVAWAATNWTAIMRKKFKWMTKEPPPAVPSWGFLISFIDHFTTCWGEQKLEAWLTDADRTEIERIMARGVTWEQAMTQHAEAKAKGVLRAEMQRVAIEADAKLRAADVTMERARKLADYAGNAPFHPRSRAAMLMKREAEAANRKRTVIEPSPGDFKGFTAAPMLPERSQFDDD